MDLNSVKAVIGMTDCKEYISSGSYCSEPIMTKDKKGIIDNYFIFGRSADLSLLEVPDISFGIYSEEKKVAYVNKDISVLFGDKIVAESFDDVEKMKANYATYEKLYPQIRVMMKDEIKESEIISQYLSCLKIISGTALFGIYEVMFPGFFKWARDTAK